MSRQVTTIAALLAVVATSAPLAQQQGTTARAVVAPPNAGAMVRVSPATVKALTTIHGNALDSTNGQLVNITVRLRDARFGRIVDTQYTDQSGMFAFKTLDPGSYIVEIMGEDDDTILAASQLLNVHGGEALSAIVKLPFRIPPFANLMGTATTQSAVGLLLEAAATGVTALVPTEPISPNQ
jgi:hypothetical protein